MRSRFTNGFIYFFVGATLVLMWISTWGAPYPQDQVVLHIPTVLVLLLTLLLVWKGWLALMPTLVMLSFWWLHILGSRYSYCGVPYDAWCQYCLGFSVDNYFHFQRNQFDRLVHVAFGLLLTPMLVDGLRRHANFPNVVAHLVSLTVITAFGSLYEIFEWLLTLADQPDRADRYVGMQGDVWDAQKDMALAICGALTASFMMNFRFRNDQSQASP